MARRASTSTARSPLTSARIRSSKRPAAQQTNSTTGRTGNGDRPWGLAGTVSRRDRERVVHVRSLVDEEQPLDADGHRVALVRGSGSKQCRTGRPATPLDLGHGQREERATLGVGPVAGTRKRSDRVAPRPRPPPAGRRRAGGPSDPG